MFETKSRSGVFVSIDNWNSLGSIMKPRTKKNTLTISLFLIPCVCTMSSILSSHTQCSLIPQMRRGRGFYRQRWAGNHQKNRTARGNTNRIHSRHLYHMKNDGRNGLNRNRLEPICRSFEQHGQGKTWCITCSHVEGWSDEHWRMTVIEWWYNFD